MPDPTTTSDPTAISLSASALTYIAGRILWDIKKYFNARNGNNPISKVDNQIKKLFEYKDLTNEKIDLLKDSLVEKIHEIDKSTGIAIHELSRIEGKLDELSKGMSKK